FSSSRVADLRGPSWRPNSASRRRRGPVALLPRPRPSVFRRETPHIGASEYLRDGRIWRRTSVPRSRAQVFLRCHAPQWSNRETRGWWVAGGVQQGDAGRRDSTAESTATPFTTAKVAAMAGTADQAQMRERFI